MTDIDVRSSSTGTVGGRLRALREGAGLSVEQVSARTRVRPAVIADLEADEFASSGGDVYARGHIRALARAVGADPVPLVEAFDEQVGVHAPSATTALLVTPPSAPPAPAGPPPPLEVRSEQPRWLLAALAGLLVLVALLLVGTFRDDGTAVDDADGPEASAPAPAPGSGPSAVAPPARPPRPTTPVVALRATGTSWLNVSTGSRTLFEGTVQAGWQQRFTSPQPLQVRIGNAAGLRVSCAGLPSAVLGAEGAVATLTCTATGPLRP